MGETAYRRVPPWGGNHFFSFFWSSGVSHSASFSASQAISMVAGPAITHKIVALSTKPLTFAAARSITTDLTHAVTHGLTHSVTHAIIHKYYCQVSTRDAPLIRR